MRIRKSFIVASVLSVVAVVTSCRQVENSGSDVPDAAGLAFFVTTTGDDGNPGTQARPFATLEAARDAVRKLKASDDYPEDGVTVYIRGGVYERDKAFVLGSEDSGTADAPVVYKAFPGETVRLVGGRRIPATAFKPVTDQTFLDQIIVAAARRKIMQVDLKAMGIDDLGEMKRITAVDFGTPDHYPPAPLELFVNGDAMTLARFPNVNAENPVLSYVDHAQILIEKDENDKPKQYTRMSTRPFTGETGDLFSTDHGGNIMGIAPLLAFDHVKRWGESPKDVWIGGGLVRAYAFGSRLITAIDTENGRITLDEPVGLWSTYNQKTAYPIYFYNVPEEIDVPGEYYVDRETGILYLYPPVGWSRDSEIVVSMLSDPIVAFEGSSHVRLRDLTLEATRTSAVYMEGGEDNIVANCELRNCGVVGAQIGMGYDAEEQKLLPRLPGSYRNMLCTGMENHPTHPRGGTALNREAGKNNGLVNCRIYNTGMGGVLLGGGDRKTLTPAGNFVRDSEIFATNRRANRYAENVVVDGVGNLIQGNYLHDNEAGIVYIHGNNHVIEYNEITGGAKTSSDCGVIETRQNPSQLGNVIRYNYIHDNGRAGNPHLNVIYLDNETHGMTIFGNVIEGNLSRTVSPFGRVVIASNGGHLHTIANNLFIDNTGGAIGDGHELDKTKHIFQVRRFMLEKDVDVREPPYSTQYPEFAEIYAKVMAGDESVKLFNRVYNNVQVGCGAEFGPGRYPDEDYRRNNLEIDDDPGFVDDVNGDYNLGPDSRVFQEIPGFEPIPFDQMRQARKW
jgi:hypothetical protein